MADPRDSDDDGAAFSEMIERRADLKLSARDQPHGAIWAGLGMSGLIGWTVVVPTVAGTMVGAYLDRHFPSEHSWTLTLLAVGLLAGCVRAWHWVSQEDHAMHQGKGGSDD